MTERDLFANFDRMRREMDELFGDVFERAGIGRRRGGFTPAVDVAYVPDPPRAIVTVELAGIDPEAVELEIRGRELIVVGERAASLDEGGVFQQVEIGRGPFRRVVSLGTDVRAPDARARYADGILRVELPLAPSDGPATTVPIRVGGS